MSDVKSAEHAVPAGLESNEQHPEEVGPSLPEQEFHVSGKPGLPFESPPEAALAGDNADETLQQLTAFFVTGSATVPAGVQSPTGLPGPALLHQFRDLSRVRHDYPVCLDESSTENRVRSLTVVIDELLAGLADDGDSGQIMKQHIYRLESEIKTLAELHHDSGFLDLWDRATKKLLSAENTSSEKEDTLRENLDTARQALDIDYEIIACDRDAPVRLLSTLMLENWQQRCQPWREQLELVIQRLEDILSVDFDHSTAAKSPDHLREATSTGDIDFDAMASILTTENTPAHLDEARSQRIRSSLATLQGIEPLFRSLTSTDKEDRTQAFSIDSIAHDCSTAIADYQARMRIMLEFFKAAAIAQLEVENRYREARHDEFFSHYDISGLSAEEMALCPPVLLVLTNDSLSKGGIAEVLDILSSGLPVKILLLNDTLYNCEQAEGRTSMVVNWPTRLAHMVMALDQVYVLQSPVSRLPLLHQGMRDGIDYDGPALFSVYTGQNTKQGILPAYLDAASATESRLFPTFCFNPARGQTLAERMDISDNSQCEQKWPLESFTYRAASDEQASVDLAFTPADLLLCDHACASQFRYLPETQWHRNMLPLHDYLSVDTEAARSCIPYLLTVDDEGRLGRVIMTRSITEFVRRCSSSWHELQELGGINNSFALNLIAAEKDRLVADMQTQVEAIEKKYAIQLDEDIGRLTGEIVQRIAAQLIQGGVAGADMAMRTMTTVAVDSTPLPATATPEIAVEEAAAIEDEEEEEEEEIGALDDPYIETPRCTSCDDCTTLNGQLFAYDENKQAYIKDAGDGPYKDLVRAAELCPVKIIHPGKPKNQDEAGLEALLQRAAPFM